MVIVYSMSNYIDKADVKEELQETELDLTEHQKASLQVYEKNAEQIDRMLDTMSEGLTDLKVW